jgi:hypothetical protein
MTVRAEFSILAVNPGGMGFLQTPGSLTQIACGVKKGSEDLSISRNVDKGLGNHVEDCSRSDQSGAARGMTGEFYGSIFA